MIRVRWNTRQVARWLRASEHEIRWLADAGLLPSEEGYRFRIGDVIDFQFSGDFMQEARTRYYEHLACGPL